MNSEKIIPPKPHNYGVKRIFSSLEDIAGKKITVMGLGLHGGGEASTRFFLKHGAYVTVTDMKSEQELSPSVASLMQDSSLDTSRLKLVLGKHDIADFINADCVIKNPIVKYDGNKYLAAAQHIESDISIFLQFTASPIIAVTGSKGKSSTASAVCYGLNKAGKKTLLGGNITVSPLTFLDDTLAKNNNPEALPIVVLELSSWQLADLRGRKLLNPHIALITKIIPDHQNWYGDMTAYTDDKKLIYADQSSQQMLLCSSNTDFGDIADKSNSRVFRYPEDIPVSLQCGFEKNIGWLDILRIPGEHNKENILNAAFIMHVMGINDEQTIDILKNYPGIAHRLEFFYEWHCNNVTYKFYNDSAATVPEASVAALQSFKNNAHFIIGGTDKELDFEPLANALKNPQATQSLFLLAGTGTDKLLAMLKKTIPEAAYKGPYNDLSTLLSDMKDFLCAENNAGEHAVVFSPGATSFGMFKNEFDRGNIFKESIKKIFT